MWTPCFVVHSHLAGCNPHNHPVTERETGLPHSPIVQVRKPRLWEIDHLPGILQPVSGRAGTHMRAWGEQSWFPASVRAEMGPGSCVRVWTAVGSPRPPLAVAGGGGSNWSWEIGSQKPQIRLEVGGQRVTPGGWSGDEI